MPSLSVVGRIPQLARTSGVDGVPMAGFGAESTVKSSPSASAKNTLQQNRNKKLWSGKCQLCCDVSCAFSRAFAVSQSMCVLFKQSNNVLEPLFVFNGHVFFGTLKHKQEATRPATLPSTKSPTSSVPFSSNMLTGICWQLSLSSIVGHWASVSQTNPPTKHEDSSLSETGGARSPAVW